MLRIVRSRWWHACVVVELLLLLSRILNVMEKCACQIAITPIPDTHALFQETYKDVLKQFDYVFIDFFVNWYVLNLNF